MKKFNPDGTAKSEEKRGRKRKTTADQDNALLEHIKQNRRTSQMKAAVMLKSKGKFPQVCQKTVSNRLTETGVRKGR